MTITTYTDKEIALKAQLAAMTLERDEYQQAADKMAMEHKVERDALRQQLEEVQSAIEASRKQDAASVLRSDEFDGHVFEPTSGWPFGKLYAAPVVADDVLKDAQRYRWLRSKTLLKTLPLVRVQIMNQGSYALQQGKELDVLIDKAIGGAE